jgi:hypothetical protein
MRLVSPTSLTSRSELSTASRRPDGHDRSIHRRCQLVDRPVPRAMLGFGSLRLRSINIEQGTARSTGGFAIRATVIDRRYKSKGIGLLIKCSRRQRCARFQFHRGNISPVDGTTHNHILSEIRGGDCLPGLQFGLTDIRSSDGTVA